jgi:hypothetical protein
MKKPPRKRKPLSRPPRKALPKELPAGGAADRPPAADPPNVGGWSQPFFEPMPRPPTSSRENEPEPWVPQPPPQPIPSGWMNTMDDGTHRALQAHDAARRRSIADSAMGDRERDTPLVLRESVKSTDPQPPLGTSAIVPPQEAPPTGQVVQLEAHSSAMMSGAGGLDVNGTLAPASPHRKPRTAAGAAKAMTPKTIRIRNRTEVIRYSKILIVALEEVLDYVPARRGNERPPALRIDDDRDYLQEIRDLVAELRALNALLAQHSPQQRKRTAGAVGGLARHFDTFLRTYANCMGAGTAALTIGVVSHLLKEAGVAPDVLQTILSHLKLR